MDKNNNRLSDIFKKIDDPKIISMILNLQMEDTKSELNEINDVLDFAYIIGT